MIPELEKLLSQPGKRILFAGIGNVLKSDDGVGVYISRRIKQTKYIFSITVEVSIENYIGKINTLNPDILVLIDCADIGASPGTCRLLEAGEVNDFTFNTHNISLKRITEFFNARVLILGIQPGTIDFGENISYLVTKVADEVIRQINSSKSKL